MAIRIEDGYWNHSDAAVVFQRVDESTGDVRYIYHGNDGTSMPWNDTAQLNFLLPEVREAVIQVILHVARTFPIIRFDAAMTLAKKHYQRLWFPAPGDAGAIPSRAEHGMSKPEFDAVFPVEFWREVVDRVAAEVPDTLLLAEAFWLMEGYFVRTLGMHRVYNSAFMNMLKMEDNAEVPADHQERARVQPRGAQALRQLHEQPRRENRRRTVRPGRQVLRLHAAAGHHARPAHARSRPDRGLQREVRHGIPQGLLGRTDRPGHGRAATSARSSP